MNLLVRINLALALAFALAALAVGWACSSMLQANATRETLREAGAAAQTPDWKRLIGRLSGEIDSDAARQQFINICRTLSLPKP